MSDLKEIKVQKSELATRLEKHIFENDVPNSELIEIMNICGDYLNLKTRSQYARENNISYNGAKHHRNNVKINGVIFIVDND